ncbi:MAG: 1-acyl-sn-glycerol-3-phosphate acyltransferase [Clostridiales bacterium]|nr:1-acyl-sn-glycerol-3-phosphate acyltransferase [Clostridiales bacterium]
MFFKVVYAAVVPLLRVFFKLLFRARVYGAENVPKSGGFIVAANHKSNFDPLVIGAFLPRKTRFLAKRELFAAAFSKWALTGLGAIPITRGGFEPSTLKTVISLLKNNEAVLVFPEGTRRSAGIGAVKAGAVTLAVKGQVPILPVMIAGAYRPFRGIKIIFGEPVTYGAYYGNPPPREELHRLSVALMENIYKLAEE